MIPLVETGGPPYAVGHDVGRAMRDQLTAALAAERAACPPGRAFADPAALRPYLDATQRAAPWVLAELRGMADGAALPFDQLFAANAGAELGQAAGHFGCTVVGITPAGTADGHALLAHNEDADAGWGDFAYVVRAEPDGAPAFAAFTYGPYLLHQGVNAAGIASVGNALYARDARPGVPKLLLYRLAIAESTVEGAIRAATHPERAFGNNHLFATADGDVYDVEVSGGHWRLLAAGNRFLAHANHFVHPDLAHLDREDDLLNSRLRQARVERLTDAAFGTITPESLRTFLADHANFPKAVCKHHLPESDLDYGTIGAVVLDATAPTLWACAGNPCRSEWREVRP